MRDARLPSIICLSGPDGSGKSTLAKLLRSHFLLLGVYAYVSWFRGSHLFASVLARLLSRFKTFRGDTNLYYRIAIPCKLRPLWTLLEFSSLLPHYLLRKTLSKLQPIIGDRGLLDFMVWIIVTLNNPKFLTNLLGRFLARLATKETAIYITADINTLHKRASTTPQQFLIKEVACYNVLAKHYAKYTIDTTNKSPKESVEELIRYLYKSAFLMPIKNGKHNFSQHFPKHFGHLPPLMAELSSA